MSIEVTGISYLTCTVAYVLASLLLALSRSQTRFKGLLLAATVITAAWSATVAGVHLVSASGEELQLAAQVLEQLRALAWLAVIAFVIVIAYGKRPDPMIASAIGIAAGASMVWAIAAAVWSGFGELPTWAVRSSFIAQILVAVTGLLLLENLFRNSGPDARWAVKYICFGLGGMFIYDFFVYAEAALFARVDATLFAARGLIGAMTAPLVIIAAARARSWPIDLHVSRRLVFHSATLLGAGIYLIVMSAAGYYLAVFNSAWGGLAQTVFVSAAVLALLAIVSSGSVQAYVREFVSRNFFSYRYDYRQEWLRFIAAISDSLTQMSIPERVVRALANIVESTGGAMWVLREEDDAYHRVAAWNMGNDLLPSLAVSDPFIAALLKDQTIIDLRRQSIGGKSSDGADRTAHLPGWLTRHPRAWLVLPLPHAAGLPGFVVLGRSRAPRVLDWEDRELLSTASRQAASYIAEANAARSLARARRFEDFNRQFAFVVHDIKNLTGQLTLILKNAERHGDNPEFQRDVLATVQDSVGRMKQLLDQLRAKRSEASAADVPVLDVAAVLARLAADWRLQIADLRIEAANTPVLVRADQDRVSAVLNHLIQNAADAAGPDGHVSVSLGIRSGQEGREDEDGSAPQQWAELVVADSGPGMDAAFINEKLFQPLDSTKAAGFGIGAYQCRQHIKELGGRLLVDSVVGAGTRMIVRLPLAAERPSSSRAASAAPQGIYTHA